MQLLQLVPCSPCPVKSGAEGMADKDFMDSAVYF